MKNKTNVARFTIDAVRAAARLYFEPAVKSYKMRNGMVLVAICVLAALFIAYGTYWITTRGVAEPFGLFLAMVGVLTGILALCLAVMRLATPSAIKWICVFVVFVGAIGVGAITGRPTPAVGSIISIEGGGTGTYEVRGDASNIPTGHKLVLATGTSDGYWPKDAEIILLSDGSWIAKVNHEPGWGTGVVILSIWSVSPKGYELIEIWLENGKMTGHYPPMKQIAGGVKLDSRAIPKATNS